MLIINEANNNQINETNAIRRRRPLAIVCGLSCILWWWWVPASKLRECFRLHLYDAYVCVSNCRFCLLVVSVFFFLFFFCFCAHCAQITCKALYWIENEMWQHSSSFFFNVVLGNTKATLSRQSVSQSDK